MKKALKIFGWLAGVLVVVCGLVFFIAWKSPKYYKVTGPHPAAHQYLPFFNYTTEHARPFIIQTKSAVVFGAEHTKDPNHAEIKKIEQAWKELKPTIALVEGRLGFLLPGLMDPVEHLGEGGKVKGLAQKDGIPLYNWDLSKEELAVQLQTKFSAEQIALYQILNPWFSQLRFGKPANEETFLKSFFKRAAYVGLQDSIKKVQDIDRIWKKYFPTIDWRNVSDETELPGYLSEMMTVTNDLRNKQLITAVKELEASGERVFAICGSSHAVCVAPAFQ